MCCRLAPEPARLQSSFSARPESLLGAPSWQFPWCPLFFPQRNSVVFLICSSSCLASLFLAPCRQGVKPVNNILGTVWCNTLLRRGRMLVAVRLCNGLLNCYRFILHFGISRCSALLAILRNDVFGVVSSWARACFVSQGRPSALPHLPTRCNFWFGSLCYKYCTGTKQLTFLHSIISCFNDNDTLKMAATPFNDNGIGVVLLTSFLFSKDAFKGF